VLSPEWSRAPGLPNPTALHTEGEFRRRRQTAGGLALAYLAQHEGALKLPEFAPALGVKDWAASHLATSAERLAQEDRRFQQSLRRIRLSFSKLTDSQI
jgi:hypothetical protein